MKKSLKYLLQAVFLLGIVVFLQARGAGQDAVDMATAPVSDDVFGYVVEKSPDFMFSAPQEFVAPTTNASGSCVREHPTQQSAPQGFTPVGRYILREKSRDYHTNYARIETEQESLLPFVDPTLEYVFLLRRIII